ncbi:hypothetical protein DHW03_16305 [Pedobacter yonginense]|uniref:O-antigen ligase-related domain-containing protein n=1 Tax=Pedobacter yonginense TaxID=651869 RepID=A0A317EI78_9SPHI|nr:O-antigen ligase family protein [Pedobacter yonginense]PWS26342.1 hypothetical protein DHW03_16305 [Pedobacter yonginense]
MKKKIGKVVPKQPIAEKAVADNRILFIFICYVFVEFIPHFRSHDRTMPQYLYLTLLNIIVLLYGRSKGLYPISLFNSLKSSWLVRLYLMFVLLCGISIFAAENLSLSIVAIAEIGVLVSALINLLALFYNRLHLIKKVAFVLAIIAILQASYALLAFNTHSVLDAISSENFKGNSGNINIFSMSFLIKLPLIFFGIISSTDYKKWVFSSALCLSSLIVFLINARASAIAIILISVIFIIYYIKINGAKKPAFFNLLYLILPLLLSLAIANMVFKAGGNNQQRFSSTLSRLKQTKNDASINARLMYWENAIKITKKYPVIGIGLNNWKVESIPYESTQESIFSIHTHNDFLQLFAETGVLNGCLYLSIFVLIFLINLKRILKPDTREKQIIALLALLMLIVFGIDSTFNFPFLVPVMQVQFCLCIVLTLLNTTDGNLSAQPQNKLWVTGLIVIAVLPLYINYKALKTAQFAQLIIENDQKIKETNSIQGTLTGDEVVAQMPFYPNVMGEELAPFVEYAGAFYMREKNFDKSKFYLDQAIAINPYLGTGYFLKAYGAEGNGLVDSAYQYAKQSIAIKPNSTRNLHFALHMAEVKKDTLGALNLYNAVSKVVKKPIDWINTYTVLNNMGYKGIKGFIREGIKYFPKDSAIVDLTTRITVDSCLLLAQKQFAQGKYANVVATYKTGLKVAPNNAYILQNLGFFYYNINKADDAIKCLKQAIEQGVLIDGKTEYYLGFLYLKKQDKINACKYLALASGRSYPDDVGVYTSCK